MRHAPSGDSESRSTLASGDELALDRQLCFALYAASLTMTKAYKPLLDPLGLTYPQYVVLLVLWEADGITVSALGERLGLDSGTLTPLLKRLQTQGLVRRLRDTVDERRVLLTLSTEGRALRARAAALPRAIAGAAGCGAAEIAELTERLTELRRRLTAFPNRAPRAPHPSGKRPPARKVA